MYWNSFAEFLAMGKHGVYVWGSFAVMALVMLPGFTGLASNPAARTEIERRAGQKGVPKIAVAGALMLKAPDGETYGDKLARVRTERELISYARWAWIMLMSSSVTFTFEVSTKPWLIAPSPLVPG